MSGSGGGRYSSLKSFKFNKRPTVQEPDSPPPPLPPKDKTLTYKLGNNRSYASLYPGDAYKAPSTPISPQFYQLQQSSQNDAVDGRRTPSRANGSNPYNPYAASSQISLTNSSHTGQAQHTNFPGPSSVSVTSDSPTHESMASSSRHDHQYGSPYPPSQQQQGGPAYNIPPPDFPLLNPASMPLPPPMPKLRKEKSGIFSRFSRKPKSPPSSGLDRNGTVKAGSRKDTEGMAEMGMILGDPNAFAGSSSRSVYGDEIPPMPKEDEGISLPWNFQHHIHVDEGYAGLPPSWSSSLAEAGFSEDEIQALKTRRMVSRTSPGSNYLYTDRPQSPEQTLAHGETTLIARPSVRKSSLPSQISSDSLRNQATNQRPPLPPNNNSPYPRVDSRTGSHSSANSSMADLSRSGGGSGENEGQYAYVNGKSGTLGIGALSQPQARNRTLEQTHRAHAPSVSSQLSSRSPTQSREDLSPAELAPHPYNSRVALTQARITRKIDPSSFTETPGASNSAPSQPPTRVPPPVKSTSNTTPPPVASVPQQRRFVVTNPEPAPGFPQTPISPNAGPPPAYDIAFAPPMPSGPVGNYGYPADRKIRPSSPPSTVVPAPTVAAPLREQSLEVQSQMKPKSSSTSLASNKCPQPTLAQGASVNSSQTSLQSKFSNHSKSNLPPSLTLDLNLSLSSDTELGGLSGWAESLMSAIPSELSASPPLTAPAGNTPSKFAQAQKATLGITSSSATSSAQPSPSSSSKYSSAKHVPPPLNLVNSANPSASSKIHIPAKPNTIPPPPPSDNDPGPRAKIPMVPMTAKTDIVDLYSSGMVSPSADGTVPIPAIIRHNPTNSQSKTLKHDSDSDSDKDSPVYPPEKNNDQGQDSPPDSARTPLWDELLGMVSNQNSGDEGAGGYHGGAANLESPTLPFTPAADLDDGRKRLTGPNNRKSTGSRKSVGANGKRKSNASRKSVAKARKESGIGESGVNGLNYEEDEFDELDEDDEDLDYYLTAGERDGNRDSNNSMISNATVTQAATIVNVRKATLGTATAEVMSLKSPLVDKDPTRSPLSPLPNQTSFGSTSQNVQQVGPHPVSSGGSYTSASSPLSSSFSRSSSGSSSSHSSDTPPFKLSINTEVDTTSPAAVMIPSTRRPLAPPSAILPPTPAPRYRGWVSEVVHPLAEFIDEMTDPREHYVDLREVAEGESGSVYAARVVNEGKLKHRLSASVVKPAENGDIMVAIKSVEILPSGSPKLSDLRCELRLLKGVQCEFVLMMDALYVDLVEDSLWIRMELMERSLADVVGLVPEGLMLQERMMARFANDVLHAVQYLLAQGIAHRDVRSDNLLLNQEGILKLADFSSAIRVTPESSTCSDPVGVVFWQAPEVRSGSYNPLKVDVWSLGATVWEMAQTEPPFSDDPSKVGIRWPPLRQPEIYSRSFHDFLKSCSQPHSSRPDPAELLETPFARNACSRHVISALLIQCRNIEAQMPQEE